MMFNVTVEQLETIRKTVDAAMEVHATWLDNLHRTFACGLPPSESDLTEDAHHRCAFGRWFYSKGNEGLRHLPTFIEVGELHEALHKTTRDICFKLKAQGKVAVNDYDVLMGEIGRFHEALASLTNKVSYTLQNIDPLTGAISRNQLLPDLKQEQELLQQTGKQYSLLLVDVDVKDINQRYGHETGDKVLRAGIQRLREVLGSSGRIYRYAGAEFVVCLPGKSMEESEETKVALLKHIGEGAGSVIRDPRGVLLIHYGIVMLDASTYLHELIDRCELSTFTFDFDAKDTVAESTEEPAPVEEAEAETEPNS